MSGPRTEKQPRAEDKDDVLEESERPPSFLSARELQARETAKNPPPEDAPPEARPEKLRSKKS